MSTFNGTSLIGVLSFDVLMDDRHAITQNIKVN